VGCEKEVVDEYFCVNDGIAYAENVVAVLHVSPDVAGGFTT
jgi:hypothetical protein